MSGLDSKESIDKENMRKELTKNVKIKIEFEKLKEVIEKIEEIERIKIEEIREITRKALKELEINKSKELVENLRIETIKTRFWGELESFKKEMKIRKVINKKIQKRKKNIKIRIEEVEQSEIEKVVDMRIKESGEL